MTRWVFIRHGRTEYNRQRLLCGWKDVPLSEEGGQQALKVGHALLGFPVQRILTSDLQRARHTADLLARAAGWTALAEHGPARVADEALRERCMGDWEGLSLDKLRKDGLSERLISWEGAPPGGESLRQVAERVLGYLAMQPHVPTLVVSHGGTLRAILGLLDGGPVAAHGRRSIGHCAIESRQLAPGCWHALQKRLAEHS